MGGWMNPTIHPFILGASASGDDEVGTPASGQGSDYARTSARANVRGQLYHDDHQEFQLSANFNETNVDSSATFPENGLTIPRHLYDSRATGMYRQVSADGTIYGGQLTLGVIGERPLAFDYSGDISFGATVFTRQPVGNKDAWLFFLSYSDERALFNYVPFPGFAYLWNPNHAWKVMAGFPLSSVTWTPDQHWNSDAMLSGFGTVHAGTNCYPWTRSTPIRFHAAFDWGGDVYRRDDNADHSDRLIFREIRYTAGCAFDEGMGRNIDLYAGYATNRQIFEGHNFLHNGNHIDVRSGPVFGINAGWTF